MLDANTGETVLGDLGEGDLEDHVPGLQALALANPNRAIEQSRRTLG